MIDELLARWRESRDPMIADRIDAIERGTPVKGKTVVAQVAACVALVERGERIADVLATPWPAWQRALPLITALMALPDDPRVAMAFARLARDRRYQSETAQVRVLRKLYARLTDLRDARTLPLMDGEHPYFVRDYVEPLLAALRALPAYVPPVRDDGALLAAIYADPDDLAARQVYGDWLAEHGDPRAQLFTAAPTVRAKLIEQHGEAWAGAIGKYFRTWHFEHGMFVGGGVRELPESVEHPAWRLVRELEGWPFHVLPLVAKLPNVRAIELGSDSEGNLPDLDGLPPLQTLALSLHAPGNFQWYLRTPVLERVPRLAIRCARAAAIADLLVQRGGVLRELEIVDDHRKPMADEVGWRFVLSRDEAPGPWTRLVARYVAGAPRYETISHFANVVGQLAPTLREIVIEGRLPAFSADEVAELARAVAKHPARSPWAPPAPRVEDGVVHRFYLGCGEARFAAIWDAMRGLDQRYEYLHTKSSSAVRPLGKDSLATAQRWLASAHDINLRHNLASDTLTVDRSSASGTIVLRGGRDVAAVIAALAALGANAAVDEAYIAYRAWTFGFRDEPRFGRCMIFSPQLARWLPAELPGATVRDGVIALAGEPTVEAAQAICAVLRPALQRGYLAEHGFDLHDRARAILGPHADARGWPIVVDESDLFQIHWDTGDRTFGVSLHADPVLEPVVLVHGRRWEPVRGDLDAVLARFADG